MKHTVELKNELYQLFKSDDILLGILGIKDKSDVDEITKRIRRNIEDDEVLNESLPAFFSYTFIPSVGVTDNYRVNRNTLEFRLYGRNQATVDKLYIRIKSLLQSKYEDFPVIAEGTFSTGLVNLTGYVIRFRPLTWS